MENVMCRCYYACRGLVPSVQWQSFIFQSLWYSCITVSNSHNKFLSSALAGAIIFSLLHIHYGNCFIPNSSADDHDRLVRHNLECYALTMTLVIREYMQSALEGSFTINIAENSHKYLIKVLCTPFTFLCQKKSDCCPETRPILTPEWKLGSSIAKGNILEILPLMMDICIILYYLLWVLVYVKLNHQCNWRIPLMTCW